MSQPAPSAAPTVSATVALSLGITCFALMGVGTAGALSGALTPFIGFRIFWMGLLVGLAALLFGITAVLRTRASSGRAGAGRAWGGLACWARWRCWSWPSRPRPAPGSPPSTTSPRTPTSRRPSRPWPGRPTSAVRPMKPLDQCHDRRPEGGLRRPGSDPAGPAAARGPGPRANAPPWSWAGPWVESDPAAGRLEATDVTGHLPVRGRRGGPRAAIRAAGDGDGSGCVVDVRSKSRVGKGDRGRQARRASAPSGRTGLGELAARSLTQDGVRRPGRRDAALAWRATEP